MKETAVQVNERKIRNGIRKQARVTQREKDKVWDRLTDTTDGKLRSIQGEWTVHPVTHLNTMFDPALVEELANHIIEDITKIRNE